MAQVNVENAVTPREHEQIVQDYVNQGSELPSDEIDRRVGIWIQSQTGADATPEQIQSLKDILLLTEPTPTRGRLSDFADRPRGSELARIEDDEYWREYKRRHWLEQQKYLRFLRYRHQDPGPHY